MPDLIRGKTIEENGEDSARSSGAQVESVVTESTVEEGDRVMPKYNMGWGTYPTRKAPQRQRTAWADERYTAGHIESVAEYLTRGGSITRVSPCVSQDRLDWPSLIASALGESAEDIERGFAWSDLDAPVRDYIAGQDRGSLVFETEEQ